MEPAALGWEPLLNSWLATLPEIIDEWLRLFLHESLFFRFCKPLFHLLHYCDVKVKKLFFVIKLKINDVIYFTYRLSIHSKCVQCLIQIIYNPLFILWIVSYMIIIIKKS